MSEKNNQDKKEMTIEDLAQIMTAGFDKTAKETDKKIDELAAMINKGFNSTVEKINQSTNEKIDQLRSELKADIAEVKADTGNIKADLNKKVDKIEYNTLVYRVERLEKKLA